MHMRVHAYVWPRPERAAACLVAAHLADPAAAERRDAETKTHRTVQFMRRDWSADDR